MVKVVVKTFHKDYLKTNGFTEVTNTYNCFNKEEVVRVMLYVRWQLERFGNHSNVDLFYNGFLYCGAI